ncbi:MAG: hypothetical protein EAZ30_02680 [Betaproteobacteria bacterium]|nr:MAG: hypothetical protein EAZ30_02680 [Betaproteobacteria bacterium]
MKGELAISTATIFELDGSRLLRDLRLPYYSIAIMREMRLGDERTLFDVYTSRPMYDEVPDEHGSASAQIERVRGGFYLSALWMLPIGNHRSRGTLFCTGFAIRLLPNRRFALEHKDVDNLRLFVRIVRLAARVSSMAKAAGESQCARLLRPSLEGHWEERCGYVVPFLNRLADLAQNDPRYARVQARKL